MERKRIQPNLTQFPEQFLPYLEGSTIYDSSCSRLAQVYYLEKGPGFYLKAAPKGTLAREAALTGYFHQKGLATEVLAYESLEHDWLLTRKVPGEDCVYSAYLQDPLRLCDTLGQLLRMLHDTEASDCPVTDHTDFYLATAAENYREGKFAPSCLCPYATAEAAWAAVEEGKQLLKRDVLLHGDYCLPNIMLDNWRFSGFIDLDHGGIGDRHVDLYWGIWSLQFNLKTLQYTERFLDAYGKDQVDMDMLRCIAAIEAFG